MKIVFISDTHTAHRKLKLPEADVLVFAGDMCLSMGASSSKQIEQVRDFDNWLGSLPYEKKICIAGNHDFVFQRGLLTNLTNAVYLEDQHFTYKGVKFFGSPWQLHFYGAFNTNEEGLRRIYSEIEDDTDVIITHGAPFGILDLPRSGRNTGSTSLVEAILRVKPKVSVFGHIHDSYGIEKDNGTTFINASMAGRHTDMKNAPVVLEI